MTGIVSWLASFFAVSLGTLDGYSVSIGTTVAAYMVFKVVLWLVKWQVGGRILNALWGVRSMQAGGWTSRGEQEAYTNFMGGSARSGGIEKHPDGFSYMGEAKEADREFVFNRQRR